MIFGVTDKKEISGVEPDAVQGILDTLATNANNPQKLNPPYYLSPEILDIEGKKVIVIYVPESSQVHSAAKFINQASGEYSYTICGTSTSGSYTLCGTVTLEDGFSCETINVTNL